MQHPWFGIYLPQLRMPFERILERTLAAEAAGFDSIWLMDHFVAPRAPEVDTYRGVHRRDRARRAHLDDSHRPSRAVRPVPPSGAARQDRGHARRDLGRPARARHRLGLRAGRARDVRLRSRTARGARREAAGVARDPRPHVLRRALRLHGRALHAAPGHRPARARTSPRADPHRRRGTEAHDAARRTVRRLVELSRLRARPHRRAATARGKRAHLDPAPGRPRAGCVVARRG